MIRQRFGSVVLYQSICPICDEKNLTATESVKCSYCGYEYKKRHCKEEILVKAKRKSFNKKLRKEILDKQNGECFYCGHKIGEYYLRKGKIAKLNLHIDHYSPFSFSCDNNELNLIGSCNICNLHKSSKIFPTLEETRKYLLFKIEQDKVVYEEKN